MTHEIFTAIDNNDLLALMKIVPRLGIKINLLASDDNLNPLEYAAFHSESIEIINLFLDSTDLKISGQLRMQKNSFDFYTALLACIRFNSPQLLQRIEARQEPGLPSLLEAKTRDGHSAVCLSFWYESNSVFDYLVDDLQADLTERCKHNNTPFMVASMVGNQHGLERIAEKTCADDVSCRKQLVRHDKNIMNSTSLHMASLLPIGKGSLNFLFDNGGRECWPTAVNGAGLTPLDVAQNKKNHPVIEFYKQEQQKSANPILAVITSVTSAMVLYPEVMSSLLIILVFFIAIIYMRRSQSIYKNKNKHYEFHLKALLPKTLGRADYKGKLSAALLTLNDADFMVYRNMVSTATSIFPYYPTKQTNVPIKLAKGGHLENRMITSIDNNITVKKSLTIYIPGTASSVENSKIDTMLCSHLASALNSCVIRCHHRLAPENRWPKQLNDIVHAIVQYHNKYQPDNLILTGYSSGGLIAFLACLILKKLNINLHRLVLFCPLMDLSGEFREINPDNFSNYASDLPNEFQSFPTSIYNLQKLKEQDSLFKNPMVNPFSEVICKCFGEKYLQKPKELRFFSPSWFNENMLKQLNFPATTFIVSEKDYFRIDVEVLYMKMLLAGIQTTKIIIPDSDHTLLWKHIFPIYLAQNPQHASKETRQSPSKLFQKILVTEEQLKDKKDKSEDDANVLKEKSSRLKKLCAKLHYSVFHVGEKENTMENTFPVYTSNLLQ